MLEPTRDSPTRKIICWNKHEIHRLVKSHVGTNTRFTDSENLMLEPTRDFQTRKISCWNNTRFSDSENLMLEPTRDSPTRKISCWNQHEIFRLVKFHVGTNTRLTDS